MQMLRKFGEEGLYTSWPLEKRVYGGEKIIGQNSMK
jgi:hypothetical protein